VHTERSNLPKRWHCLWHRSLNTPGETSLLQGFTQVWVSRNIYLILAQIHYLSSERKIPLSCSTTCFQIPPDIWFGSARFTFFNLFGFAGLPNKYSRNNFLSLAEKLATHVKEKNSFFNKQKDYFRKTKYAYHNKQSTHAN